jgi:hypothetical protein
MSWLDLQFVLEAATVALHGTGVGKLKKEGLFPTLSVSDRNAIRSEYPVPIATMFMRVQKGRNDEASAFDLMRHLQGLFEVTLKLFAAIVTARYRFDNLLVGLADNAVEAELRKFSGTVGDGLWKELLRNVLNVYNRKELDRTNLPGLTEVKQLLVGTSFKPDEEISLARKEIRAFIQTSPGFDQKLDSNSVRVDAVVNYMTILADLKDFRNAISHVGGLHPKEYVRQNRTLAFVLGTLLKDAAFLKNFQLGTVRQVLARSASEFEAVVSMSKGTEVENYPELPIATSEFLQPGHTYLWFENNENYKPLLDLHPFVILEYCTQDQSYQYFFFNGSPPEPTAYASYRCGHQLTFPVHAKDLGVFRELARWKDETWLQGVKVAAGSKAERFRQIVKDQLQTLFLSEESSSLNQAAERSTELVNALAQKRERLVFVAEAMQLTVAEGEQIVDDLLARHRLEQFSRLVRHASVISVVERDVFAAHCHKLAEILGLSVERCASILNDHLVTGPESAVRHLRPPSIPPASTSSPPGDPDLPVPEVKGSIPAIDAPVARNDRQTQKAKQITTTEEARVKQGPASGTSDPFPRNVCASKAENSITSNAVEPQIGPSTTLNSIALRSDLAKLASVPTIGDLVIGLEDGFVARVVDGRLLSYPASPSRMKVIAGQGATRVWIGGWDEMLHALEPSGVIWSRRLVGTVSALGPSPIGGLCTVGTWAGEMLLIDAAGGVKWSKRCAEGVHALVMDERAERILRADLGGTIAMLDTSGNVLWGLSLDGLLTMASWEHARNIALVSGNTVHLVTEAGRGVGFYEASSSVIACWPARTPQGHVVASEDGSVVLIEPSQRVDGMCVSAKPMLELGPIIACAGSVDRIAWVNKHDAKFTLHLQQGAGPSREIPLSDAEGAVRLFWPRRSAWLWLKTGDARLSGYLDEGVLATLAPVSLDIQCTAMPMALSRYGQLSLKLRNTGERKAKDLTIDVEGEFVTTGLPLRLGELAGGSELETVLSIRPTVEGHVPLTAVARFRDEVGGPGEERRLLHVEVQATSRSGVN